MTVRVWVLKEWAATISALASGKTIVLLRKGGIREPEFALVSRQVLLYPTRSHQDPSWLKPEFAALATEPATEPVSSIAYRAEITDWFALADPANIAALLPFHIWTADFVEGRLAWQPDRPLQVLLLRTYLLPVPIALSERPRGCRSWFELSVATDIPSAGTPALDAERYQRRVRAAIEAMAATGDYRTANPRQ